MDYGIFDIETDGLLDTMTKIHCMVVIDFTNGVRTIYKFTDIEDMRNYIRRKKILIGHNITRFDLPALSRVLRETIYNRPIDTLALSWYLYLKRKKHGLDEWGEDLGISKPPIKDWQNLSIEEYLHRCTTDCLINEKLFDLFLSNLKVLYSEAPENIDRVMGYLTYKLQCAAEQEELRWRLDVAACEAGLEKLTKEFEERTQQLSSVMPKVTKYRIAKRPKVLHKKDGSVSSHGEKWFAILKEKNLPEYYVGDVKIPIAEEPGNPGGTEQLKNWLFSLGWVPDVFKFVKEDDGSVRRVPQISEDGHLTESVKDLIDIEPNIEILGGYFMLRHRIGLLKGFLENKSHDNHLMASVSGFTNTLRFKHSIIVNLPKVSMPYGDIIRGCLIAPTNNHILCGSDMSSLEDSTKQHYMYFFDPEYVKEMRVPGFDPHIDIAHLSNMITLEDVNFYKWYEALSKEEKEQVSPEIKDRHKKIKQIRSDKAKKTNFSAVYGAGAPKIAITAKIPVSEAKLLHTTYWKRNKAVKLVAQSCITKRVGNTTWLWNPVSKFWYHLVAEKDKFSTLNQGTGVYCFDTWTCEVRKEGIRLCGQFHDEIIAPLPNNEEVKEEFRKKLTKAIEETNNKLKLNVPLGISIDFGFRYSEIH